MELNGNFVYTDAVIKLMVDAEAAGYTVTTSGSAVRIVKTRQFARNVIRVKRGVRVQLTINLDGTSRFHSAYRLDVDPSLVNSIRTIKEVRKVLELS